MEVKSYHKILGVFRNPAVKRELRALEPQTDHQRMVQLLVGYEFPYDVNRALELALFHTFASPSISGLLSKTGQFRNHGQKRYDDTSLLVARFLQDGLDSETGKKAIAQINRIHSHFKIPNADYLFVLSTFILYPIEWINRFGWRKLTASEEQAFFLFFIEVGKEMNIADLPQSLEGLKAQLKAYEDTHLRFHPSNRETADATVQIVKNWLPAAFRFLVQPAFSVILKDSLLFSFGYKKPGAFFTLVFTTAMRIRKTVLRYLTFKPYPTLISNTLYRTYPNGLPEIEDTGSDAVLKTR